jgi:hypothetical protein
LIKFYPYKPDKIMVFILKNRRILPLTGYSEPKYKMLCTVYRAAQPYIFNERPCDYTLIQAKFVVLTNIISNFLKFMLNEIIILVSATNLA